MLKRVLKCLAPIVLSFLVSFPMVRTSDGRVINFDNIISCRQVLRGKVQCRDCSGTVIILDFDNSDIAANEFMYQYESWLISKNGNPIRNL